MTTGVWIPPHAVTMDHTAAVTQSHAMYAMTYQPHMYYDMDNISVAVPQHNDNTSAQYQQINDHQHQLVVAQQLSHSVQQPQTQQLMPPNQPETDPKSQTLPGRISGYLHQS